MLESSVAILVSFARFQETVSCCVCEHGCLYVGRLTFGKLRRLEAVNPVLAPGNGLLGFQSLKFTCGSNNLLF